jgi:hypothetical protein
VFEVFLAELGEAGEVDGCFLGLLENEAVGLFVGGLVKELEEGFEERFNKRSHFAPF